MLVVVDPVVGQGPHHLALDVIRLEHLDKNGAEEAIRKPLRIFNRDSPVKVEVTDDFTATLLNQADALMANDIPQIPLFARPGFLIHERRIQGILRNPTQQTALWNVNAWWSTSR